MFPRFQEAIKDIEIIGKITPLTTRHQMPTALQSVTLENIPKL